jgi:hypothetical protein
LPVPYSPCTSNTTVSAPARRFSENRWQSVHYVHSPKDVSTGNAINTTLSVPLSLDDLRCLIGGEEPSRIPLEDPMNATWYLL